MKPPDRRASGTADDRASGTGADERLTPPERRPTRSRGRRPTPPGGRRLLLAALLLVALAVALEAASHVLWWASEGTRFSAAEVERLAGEAAAGRRQTAARREANAAAQERRVRAASAIAPYLHEESLHPFFGYVVDPDVNLLAEDPFPGVTVTPHGFLALDGDLAAARPPGPEPLRVAVFGGSVAYVFTLNGREGLARGLAAAGVVPPGGIELVGRALGGWKQPQQLMALTWFLAHGERYDAVVVLDGFNELALSKLENADSKLNPFYPRAWRLRVRGLADADLEERLGELAWLRRRRAERAEAFAGGPWRRAATAGLVWRALDRRAAAAVAAAENRVADWRLPRHRPFVARGPDFSYPSDDALYRDLAAFWARSSRQMHDLAAARGIAYAHFLQPNQYVPGSKPLSAEERRSAFTPGHVFQAPVVEGWPHLAAAGEELREGGVAFHDLTGLFAERRETLYIDDCCHLNPRGNELLGEAIGRALAPQLTAAGRAVNRR